MDIKLNARLSAYSHVASFTPSDYTPPVVTPTEIDSLFISKNDPQAVTKSEIDTLFDDKPDITTFQEGELAAETEITNVSKADIDSLFR